MSDQVTETDRRAEAQVPSTFMEYVRAMGPGLLVAMAWLSAGDLVSASVSGSTYGYALMWALVLALFARFFFVFLTTSKKWWETFALLIIGGIGLWATYGVVAGLLSG